jgi:hypothetical protein
MSFAKKNKVLAPIYEHVASEGLDSNAYTLPSSINLAITCFIQDLSISEVEHLARATARTYKILNYGLDRNNPIRKNYKMFKYVNNVTSIHAFLVTESMQSKKPLFQVLDEQRKIFLTSNEESDK